MFSALEECGQYHDNEWIYYSAFLQLQILRLPADVSLFSMLDSWMRSG